MSVLSLLTEVLFVGHSLVGPTLPPLVEGALIRQGDSTAQVEAQVINGASLRYSWENADEGEALNARTRLAAGGVDALVLTEAVPLAPQITWNDTVGQIVAFGLLARSANPEARIYLYETWHSLKSGPDTVIAGDDGAGVPWRERIVADTTVFRDLAAQASAELGGGAVQVIPAAQALLALDKAIAAGEVPGIADIGDVFNDDIHPNGKGFYFLALVHAAAISGQDIADLPTMLTRTWSSRDAMVTDAQARVFRQIAAEVVQAQPVIVAAQAAPEEAASTGAATVRVLETPAAPPIRAAGAGVATPVAAVPPPVAFTAVSNPNLSLGLAGINDWSVQQPFLDVMKTARNWTGHLPDQWGGFDHDRLSAEGYLDAQGWPKAVPPGVTGLSTLILTHLPNDAGGVAGRYVLTYQGKGTLLVEGRATNLQTEAPGRMTFDYTPGEGSVMLTLTALDPADPLRNIVVVRADQAAALAAGAIFNPAWLDRLRGVRGLRFMDWMATNNATLSAAADRPRPEDFTFSNTGAPIEVMVALANELDADPWFTLPHQATDELVKLYADYVRDNLEPGRKAWVELSNEVWNGQFTQAGWAAEQAKARWGQDDAGVQYYALRAAEVADIWAAAFGDQADTRLVRVIATQTGWYGLEEQILSAPLVMAEGRAAPATHFDAYAVTGYFSALLGTEDKVAQIRQWLVDSAAADPDAPYAMATARAAQELRDGSVTGDPTDSLKSVVTELLPYHADVAQKYGLRLVMYEGGTHVVGYGPQVDDAEVTAFFTHFNYTPEMAALYAILLAEWAKLTDAPFNAFVDVYAPGKWGSWGAMRHLGDENPRWQVLAKGCTDC
ncbi:MAG: hypothetical protein MUD11_05780 [Rhodobacteraceae bacterium]|nr:hypothetical protein [Paracoccaceae bacterium]